MLRKLQHRASENFKTNRYCKPWKQMETNIYIELKYLGNWNKHTYEFPKVLHLKGIILFQNRMTYIEIYYRKYK